MTSWFKDKYAFICVFYLFIHLVLTVGFNNIVVCFYCGDVLNVLVSSFHALKREQLDSKDWVARCFMLFWCRLMKFLTLLCFKSAALETAFVGHCTKTRTQSFGQTVGQCQLECCSHKRTVPLAWKECAAFYAHSRFGNLFKVFLWKLKFSRKRTLKIDQSFLGFKSYFLHS